MLKPHIVILGAGFGGTYVAKKLAHLVKTGKLDATIINKTNYFLFTPLLHEVATGSLSPSSVAEPLREIFLNTGIQLCQGNILSINTVDRRVHVSDTMASSSHRHTILYDYLVIATGAETSYYDIPGAEKFTYPLKNLVDAARIRDRIIDSFEEAVLCEDPAERMRLLSFAVVGGGPTGVETTAELAEFVDGMLKRYYSQTNSDHAEETKITLIHTGDELLPHFAMSLRTAARERLEKEGVIVHLGSTVTAVNSSGLNLSNSTTIPAATIIWAAGVKPVIPDFGADMPPTSGGRLVIDKFFRIIGDDRVFALGDVAGDIPMLAQAAVQQARVVAQNIVASVKEKPLHDFQYRSKGTMVSVGQWFAIGEIFSMKIAGKLTWWMWRTVYLFKFASWKKRIRIAFEWTLDVFYPRDITKLT